MEEQIIVYSELLNYWDDYRTNIRKKFQGKEGYNKRINLNSILLDNGNKKKCKNRFNFTKSNYNRCKSCSEFCMLSLSGEPENEEICIENSIIKTTKIERTNYEMYFEKKNFNYNSILPSYINNINENYYILKITNDNIRNVALCLFLEFLKISNNLLTSYLCDDLVIVEKIPSIEIKNFSQYELEKIIFNFIRISERMIHGDETLENVKFYYQNKEIVTKITPSLKSTVVVPGYSKKNVIILSEDYDENYQDDFPLDVIISSGNNSLDFPMIEKYKKMSTIVVRPTEQLFNFYEKRCLNVLPAFNFYMWMILLMSNIKFYSCFSDEILNLLFIPEDLINIRSQITDLHMVNVTRQTIKEFCIKLNFAMKPDITTLMRDYFSKQKDE